MAAPGTGGKAVAPVVELQLNCGLVLHTTDYIEYGTVKPADSKFDYVCECAQ